MHKNKARYSSMKKISFRYYMDLQARFLIYKRALTGLDFLFLATMYAERLNKKIITKYKVMR